MTPLLRRVRPHRYTIPSPLGAGLGNSDLVVLVKTIQLYLEYDRYLRAGTANQNPTPFSYNNFTLAFNMQPAAEADPSQFAIENLDGPGISGPSPTLAELVGAEEPTFAPPANNLAMPEGGRSEWQECSIAERKAKKVRPEVSRRPMRTETNCHTKPASTSCNTTTTTSSKSTPASSNSTSTLGSSSSTSAAATAGDHVMDVEEGDRYCAEKGKQADEDTSKKQKKK
ncbi:hypothetical protein BDR05DRAFT_1000481 [Suillus weaverae]|nr:hypothetical protein BDR05DRAFT_1000481 [Suillus weaverae]